MAHGVWMADPDQVFIDTSVELAAGARLSNGDSPVSMNDLFASHEAAPAEAADEAAPAEAKAALTPSMT